MEKLSPGLKEAATNHKAINSNRLYPALLCVFFLFFALHNHYYSLWDQSTILLSDSPRHLLWAADVFDKIKVSNIFSLIFSPVTYCYPYLVYIITSIHFSLTGFSLETALFSQWIFPVVLIVSVFLTGCEIKDKKTGFLASLMLMGFPYLGKCCRDYCLDVPLAAMFCLALLFLIRSRGFTDKNYTLAFFTTSAMGMLTKTSFFAYMAAPFIAVFAGYLKNRIPPEKRLTLIILSTSPPLLSFIIGFLLRYASFPAGVSYETKSAYIFTISVLPVLISLIYTTVKRKNDEISPVTTGILLFFLIIWPYYGIFWHLIYQKNMELSLGGVNVKSFSQYLRFIFFDSLGLNLGIFGFSGLIYLIRQKIKTDSVSQAALITGTAFAGGFIIFSLIPAKDDRYFLPITGTAALLGALFITEIKSYIPRLSATAVSLYLCMAGLFGWCFYQTLPGAPLRFVEKISRHAYRRGIMTHRPPSRIIGVRGLCRCINTLSGGKPVLIVSAVEYQHPAIITGNGLYVYMRYDHGINFKSISSFETISLNQVRLGKSFEHNSGAYGYLFLSASPSVRSSGNYHSIITLNLKNPKNLHAVPLRLRNDLINARLPRRPDVVVNTGPGLSFESLWDDLEIILTRIPLNSPE